MKRRSLLKAIAGLPALIFLPKTAKAWEPSYNSRIFWATKELKIVGPEIDEDELPWLLELADKEYKRSECKYVVIWGHSSHLTVRYYKPFITNEKLNFVTTWKLGRPGKACGESYVRGFLDGLGNDTIVENGAIVVVSCLYLKNMVKSDS